MHVVLKASEPRYPPAYPRVARPSHGIPGNRVSHQLIQLTAHPSLAVIAHTRLLHAASAPCSDRERRERRTSASDGRAHPSDCGTTTATVTSTATAMHELATHPQLHQPLQSHQPTSLIAPLLSLLIAMAGRPAAVHSAFQLPFLALSLLLLLLPLPSSASPSVPLPSYTVWGPTPINPVAVAAVNASVYGGRLAAVGLRGSADSPASLGC